MTRRLAEVAKYVGVSTATVSRVLNGRPGISEATRTAAGARVAETQESLLAEVTMAVSACRGAVLERVAADGSVLVASLAVHAEGLDSATIVARGNARRRTAAAEPFQTILPVSGQVALLASGGWQVTASVDAADLGTGAEPGRSLLVTAAPAG